MNNSTLPLVMFDSCVLIDAIQKKQGHYPQIEPYVLEAEEGRMAIVLSTVTLAEVCYLKERHKAGVSLEEQIRQIEDWFDRQYVDVVGVSRAIARKAARLRDPSARAKLTTPDAIILATALSKQIPKLLTYDGAGKNGYLLKLNGQVGGSPPLRVIEPDGRPLPAPLLEQRDEQELEEEARNEA